MLLKHFKNAETTCMEISQFKRYNTGIMRLESLASFGLLTVTLFATLNPVIGYNITDFQRLKKALLVDQEYDKTIRPIVDQSLVMKIKIAFAATSILDFNLVSGRLGITGYLFATWTDEQLVWTPADFGGIESVQLSMDTVWTPGLKNAFDLSDSFDVSRVIVFANGRVTWLPANIFYSICSIDITYYPYDEHMCEFPIFSSTDDDSTIVFQPMNDTPKIDNFTTHGEWQVFASQSVEQRIPDPNINVWASYFVNSLKLRRRPKFAILHTYFPLLLLSLLNILTFLVPLDKGERVSFAITLLLALIFFTASTTATLPQTSLTTSYFSSTVTLSICASTLGVMISVILVRLEAEIVWSVPHSLQIIARSMKGKKRGWLFCRDKNVVVAIQDPKGDAGEKYNVEDVGTKEDKAKDDESVVTWHDVAEAINTILLVVYSVGLIIGIVVLGILHQLR